ncbi:hypothetical protein SSP531S_38470 [Streptomyces spongiicola]|uniref:Uncharacterized protein n=1 Tax=Streptomyces spongiicola TaxID=1690221 RepID=A0A388T0E9_9ACTN|nr:hypothetical protein [Streptomyces spongiicola]GBQ02388.1 hypothetical protein SSP531S_38470 [Streptomyces spongiicola]
MPNRPCGGTVHRLQGRTVCFTGRVLVKGEWTVRTRCAERARELQAIPKTDFSRKVTLVVYGDLASKVVTDDRRAYSSTLVRAEAERRRGRHVCVVDADGFSKLLDGRPAPCLELRRARTGRVRPVAATASERRVRPVAATASERRVHPVAATASERRVHPVVATASERRVLGGPLRVRRTGRRTVGDLTLDLSRLDEGTAVHEATVGALIRHLSRQGIEACGHAPGGPEFDAGWLRGEDVFIAEVKSLTGAREDQQIRLGIGQVLDYAHQLRTAYPRTVTHPVLVLERRPSAARWTTLADSIGLRLTWAPDFGGL